MTSVVLGVSYIGIGLGVAMAFPVVIGDLGMYNKDDDAPPFLGIVALWPIVVVVGLIGLLIQLNKFLGNRVTKLLGGDDDNV